MRISLNEKKLFAGSLIYSLRGFDPDGDSLIFGVRNQPGSNVIRVENFSPNEANIYLNKLLDREVIYEIYISFLLLVVWRKLYDKIISV